MKFSIQSNELLKCLNVVVKAVNHKNAIGILKYFLFEIQNGTLTITGSDQENTIKANLSVSADDNIKICFNALYTLNIFKEITEQLVTFEIKENFNVLLTYQNGLGRYEFVGIDGNEYPQIATKEDAVVSFQFPAKDISKAVHNTIFAVGDDSNRQILNGIYWDITPDKITFAATDTFVLVRYINRKLQTGQQIGSVIPGKACSVLEAILPNEDIDVKVAFSEKGACFETEKFVLCCACIKGVYPKYNSVIPLDNPYVATIDRQSFLGVTKRVSVFDETKESPISLKLTPNRIEVSYDDYQGVNVAKEDIECSYDGKPIEIAFKARKMLEVLNTIPSDNVLLKIGDASRPGLFAPEESSEEEDYVVLLMPTIR